MKKVEIPLHGQQEEFSFKMDNFLYTCFITKFRVQEGWSLVKLEGLMKDEPCENFSYIGMIHEYDNKLKLKDYNNKGLPRDLQKELNKRFSKTWKIHFV